MNLGEYYFMRTILGFVMGLVVMFGLSIYHFTKYIRRKK